MPERELERQQVVNRFLHLEISKERELQEIVRLAAEICQVPTALITLLDADTQYIKFKFGFDAETTPRQDAFCNYTIEHTKVMVVPDALLDDRFVDSLLVNGETKIRFYAGSPLTTHDGYNLGSLCVMDRAPKMLTGIQRQMLEVLSKEVIHILEFDLSLKILKEQFIAAKNSEIKLRSFFESSSAIHLLIGKNLEVIAFNKAFADFIKNEYEIDVQVEVKVTDYVHPAYAEDFINNYYLALKGKSNKIERQLQYAEQSKWWHLTFDPARNPEGEIIGVSYNGIDITKRMEQEQTVLAQNESLKKIAYIQSHELRKPVASIMGIMNIFKAQDYTANKDELLMMDRAVAELDEQIRLTVNYTENPY
jgi:PAS domain S-box-containing protein